MISIGFGTTVLSRGMQRNHVDGIGVYTKELFNAIGHSQQVKLTPMVFGSNHPSGFADGQIMANHFYSHLLKHQLWGEKIKLSNDIDVLHATDNHIPYVKNKPVIATIFDLIPILHPQWLRSRLSRIKVHYFKKSILAADHYITISEYSKKDMIEHLGISEAKISVTPLGVNPDFFTRIDASVVEATLKKLNIASPYFLFVGTLQPRKNIEGMLAAHALLSPSERKNFPIILVGSIGTASEKLLKAIDQAQTQGYLKWLKYLPDLEVKVLLQSATAMLYVSLYEGFGLPVVEAFAAQCPVITSNTTSIPEVAGDGALFVNPKELSQIAEAMKKLIENDKLRQALIEKGYQRAQYFTWSECAKQTIEVYKKFK